MEHYWELYMITAGFALLTVWIIVELCYVAYKDYKKWKAVRPYYGKPYDASSRDYRPNVDLRRMR